MEKNIEKINRLRKFLIYIYGEKEGTKRCGNLMKGSSLRILQFKFGKSDGLKRYNELREIDKFKNTLDGFISRYGVDEGTKRYHEKNKRLSVNIENLRRNGFSEEEIKKIREKHSKGSKTDLKSMVNKYGEKEGRERYEKKMSNYYNPWDYKCVMEKDGLTEKEAKKLVSKRQIRDKEFFIRKYGKEEGVRRFLESNKKKGYYSTKEYHIEKYGGKLGLIKYKELCHKKGYHSTKEYHIGKYGEELGLIKYKELIKKKVNYFPDFSSRIESEFNQSIFNLLSDEQKSKFYGCPITKPYFLNVDEEKYNTVCIVPDIKIGNIIIEFDGDYWHSLPNIIERDELKDEIYSDYGFKVKRINELEYINNKDSVLNKVINFINKNIKL